MQRGYAPFTGLMLIVAGILLQGASAGATPLIIDAQQQYQFAQQLFDEGRFKRAAEEFERFAFFFPDAPQRRIALYNAGHSFLRAGDPVTALQRFNGLIDQGILDSVAVDTYFMTAECYLMLNNPNQAVLQLHNLIMLSEDTAVKDRAYLRIAWILIEQMDWPGARRALSSMSTAARQEQQIEALEKQLAKADHLPRKTPALAGTLSIIPGAGQLYCGRYEDALAALIVNGGLFWAAYESFDNDLNALGGLLTLAGLGFYAGNIYGAVSSAHKYNQRERKSFIEQLRQHLTIDIKPNRASRDSHPVDTIALTLHFKF